MVEKGREQGMNDDTKKLNSPIFSTIRSTSAKYRTIPFFLSFLIPCSLPFYTTIALKSYMHQLSQRERSLYFFIHLKLQH